MLWMALEEGWSFEMATPRGGGLRGFGVWRVEGFLGLTIVLGGDWR